MSTLVLSFQEIDQTKLTVVGGKGTNLGEFSKIKGIHVPDGFCISTVAFKRIIEETSLIHELLDRAAGRIYNLGEASPNFTGTNSEIRRFGQLAW